MFLLFRRKPHVRSSVSKVARLPSRKHFIVNIIRISKLFSYHPSFNKDPLKYHSISPPPSEHISNFLLLMQKSAPHKLRTRPFKTSNPRISYLGVISYVRSYRVGALAVGVRKREVDSQFFVYFSHIYRRIFILLT